MPLILTVISLTFGILQDTYGELHCPNSTYYNKTLNKLCCHCPKGFLKRYPCIKDTDRYCKEPCPNGYFINWEKRKPQCEACVICSGDPDLVQIQQCSSESEAKCQCKSGHYCVTPTGNTCSRCNPHRKCEPGYGVKQKGTHESDTVCELCPSGSYSDVHSATDGCKPHTDCAKMNLLAVSKGDSTKDKVCQDPTVLKTVKYNKQEKTTQRLRTYPLARTVMQDGDNIPSAAVQTIVRSPTASTVIQSKILTASEPFRLGTVNKEDTADTGKWSPAYVVTSIICVAVLVISFLLVWKQKICKMKQFLLKQEGFPQFKLFSGERTTLIKYEEDCRETKLLNRPNISPYQDLTLELESCVRTEHAIPMESERLEQKAEIQGRDQLNNRIEKIYIMKADTVLVGSISEIPNRQISISTDCESQSTNCKDNTMLASHYPEQESSKMSVNEVMLSVEEEGKRSLQTTNDTANLCSNDN